MIMMSFLNDCPENNQPFLLKKIPLVAVAVDVADGDSLSYRQPLSFPTRPFHSSERYEFAVVPLGFFFGLQVYVDCFYSFACWFLGVGSWHYYYLFVSGSDAVARRRKKESRIRVEFDFDGVTALAVAAAFAQDRCCCYHPNFDVAETFDLVDADSLTCPVFAIGKIFPFPYSYLHHRNILDCLLYQRCQNWKKKKKYIRM
mmetsp:Transcript_23988/g.25699  ORF Transcript_23988/g.25699 Transcript_23988/m.25699 type:complete len:201 (-) Transcript_23988:72-674(-)